MIKIDDLWEKCQSCEGTGKEKPGKMVGGGISITPGACNKCGGRGGKPTASGQAIKEFLDFVNRPAAQSW